MSGALIGVVVDGDRASGVLLVDEESARRPEPLAPDDRGSYTCRGAATTATGGDGAAQGCAGSDTAASLVGRVVARLVRDWSGRVDRLVVSTSAPVDRLTGDGPIALPRVGVLRIGAPATTSIPPLTGWPARLADAVRGPVAVVRGGHRYDGREFAPLDTGAVSAFGAACRDRCAAVAVSATDSPMNPAHEQEARRLLGELLGPAVPVITSHEVGGAGLLERENTAVLGAAVAPATRRFAEQTAAAIEAVGVDADLYLMGGDGTVLPVDLALRHPLHLLGAVHGAARVGAGRLSGAATLTVVEARGGRVRISPTLLGASLETGTFTEVAGVRTVLRALRTVELPVAVGGRAQRDGRPGAAGREHVRAEVARAAALAPGGPVVVVGDEVGALPVPLLPAQASGAAAPDPAVWRPERPELAAAFGAATGEASGTVDPLFFFGDGGREHCVAAARRVARERAVRSGADPRLLRIGDVREAAMTYVPVPCVRLRVTATGPIMAAGGDR